MLKNTLFPPYRTQLGLWLCELCDCKRCWKSNKHVEWSETSVKNYQGISNSCKSISISQSQQELAFYLPSQNLVAAYQASSAPLIYHYLCFSWWLPTSGLSFSVHCWHLVYMWYPYVCMHSGKAATFKQLAAKSNLWPDCQRPSQTTDNLLKFL